MRIELYDGKYTVIEDNGIVEVLRNGEPWRKPVGDNLILALVQHIEDLEDPRRLYSQVFDILKNLRPEFQHVQLPHGRGRTWMVSADSVLNACRPEDNDSDD